ncbi:Protoporphyrinogen IX oxidase, menaquinone-dependent (flavodoxin domain) [Chitinophaga eiseniae]|uniref:Protoporphyrinogen IX oxidase, menaquinone-dependent (Flavodoxin domain) n=1 Tax=Chitinophaga eiseniae TaxID=634771 RepID=A0A1T4SLU2_9BACT|nr:flavodoxin domain-containing protein [Chitinophaga eiseniae]SKA29189.1 Protoporphyrinogen IX oxidase, menaquinone-dependent (flavodoxin domain) [Chitinophaga eiseniae]
MDKKGIIIYKGKYGATQQYATWLAAALDIQAVTAGKETKEQLSNAAYVILGTSIYIGKLQLRRWISNHTDQLADKRLFLFLVAGTPVSEKQKLEAYLNANISAGIRSRCKCFFLPGKLEFRKLSRLDRWLLTIGARLAKGRSETIVTADYNHVRPENLDDIIKAVRAANEVPA